MTNIRFRHCLVSGCKYRHDAQASEFSGNSIHSLARRACIFAGKNLAQTPAKTVSQPIAKGTQAPAARYSVFVGNGTRTSQISSASLRRGPTFTCRPNSSTCADMPVLALINNGFRISTARNVLQAKCRSRQLVPKNHPSLVTFTKTSTSRPDPSSELTCCRMKCGTVDSKQMFGATETSLIVMVFDSVPAFHELKPLTRSFTYGIDCKTGKYSPNITKWFLW